jgi:hypothetical protein
VAGGECEGSAVVWWSRGGGGGGGEVDSDDDVSGPPLLALSSSFDADLIGRQVLKYALEEWLNSQVSSHSSWLHLRACAMWFLGKSFY